MIEYNLFSERERERTHKQTKCVKQLTVNPGEGHTRLSMYKSFCCYISLKVSKQKVWKNMKIKNKFQLQKEDKRSQESSPKPSSNGKNTNSASGLKFIKDQQKDCLP